MQLKVLIIYLFLPKLDATIKAMTSSWIFSDYSFFEKRALLLCYRMAYIKSNMPEHFSLFMEERCKKDSIQS